MTTTAKHDLTTAAEELTTKLDRFALALANTPEHEYQANGQIIAALTALFQQLLPLILQLLPLFIKPAPTPPATK